MPINWTNSVAGGTANNVSQGSVTFAFDDNYVVGNYANGPAYVVVPSGTATITSITPAQTTLSGEVINGAAKNLQWGDDQPFDERTSIRPGLGEYNPTKQFTTGTVQAGDIIIKAVSNTTAGIVSGNGASTRKGLCDEWAALFVVGEAPPAGAFSPSAMGWAGRSTPAPHYTVDVAAFVAALPSYNTTGQTVVPYADLIEHIGQYAPISIGANNVTYYQEMLPRNFGNEGGTAGNYGEDVNDWMNPSCLALISDGYTTEQKETLARYIITHGINWGDPLENVTVPTPNGGHYVFQVGPIVAARAATGRANTTTIADMGINWAGAFQFTPALVATLTPHDSMTDPFIYRRRNIVTGGVSGNVITVPFVRSGVTGDPAWVAMPTGMRMVRESDGASAAITSGTFTVPPNATTDKSITIDAQPAPAFADGDTIYFEPVVMPVVGDFDWAINGLGQFNNYNPSGSASYRLLNRWLGASLLIKAAGWTGDFDAALGYVNRCQSSANDPAGDDFPPHHSTTWESEFWTQHGATIFP